MNIPTKYGTWMVPVIYYPAPGSKIRVQSSQFTYLYPSKNFCIPKELDRWISSKQPSTTTTIEVVIVTDGFMSASFYMFVRLD